MGGDDTTAVKRILHASQLQIVTSTTGDPHTAFVLLQLRTRDAESVHRFVVDAASNVHVVATGNLLLQRLADLYGLRVTVFHHRQKAVTVQIGAGTRPVGLFGSRDGAWLAVTLAAISESPAAAPPRAPPRVTAAATQAQAPATAPVPVPPLSLAPSHRVHGAQAQPELDKHHEDVRERYRDILVEQMYVFRRVCLCCQSVEPLSLLFLCL